MLRSGCKSEKQGQCTGVDRCVWESQHVPNAVHTLSQSVGFGTDALTCAQGKHRGGGRGRVN